MKLYKNCYNKEIVCNINNFYQVINKITLGNVNELSFQVPYAIEDINGDIIDNPEYNKLKNRYYILLEYNNIKEWYMINNPIKDSSIESKQIKAYTTPYLLRDTKLYNYEVVSYTIEEILNGNTLDDKRGILYNTTWSVGHIDDNLKKKKRGITNNGETSVLDAIFNIAQKFNAIIEWDTLNERINFYDEENYNNDKGLVIQYNKYLENIKEEEKSDEFCTVLKIQGKDNTNIANINPSGKTYLTDYSYFMYPFKIENDEIINHSDYMSDDLCKSLLNFDEVVNKNKGKLQQLITKKYIFNKAITQKELQLKDLHSEYDAILKALAVSQSLNSQQDSLLEEKKKKFKQIQQRENDIKFVKKQKQSLETQINSIKFIMSERNNFTPSQIEELKTFRIEKTYVNNNITDEKELYLAGSEYFDKIKRPKKVLTINIINFLNVVDSYKDWNKLRIGDLITINYHKFGVDKIKSRITEINISHDARIINLTISNLDDENDEKRLSKMLYNINSTSAIIDETPSKINSIKDTVNNLNEIINNTWKTAQRQIFSGTNNTTIINQLGLTSMEHDNKKRGIRINNGSLQYTKEGENFFKAIINGDGLDVSLLNGKIEGDNVKIDGDNVVDKDGNKIDEKIEELKKRTKDDKFDTDKAVQETDKRVEKIVNNIIKMNSDTENLRQYVDSVTDDIGAFKVETNKLLASKVANEEFTSYKMQTADKISSEVDSLNNSLRSYINQTAGSINSTVQGLNNKFSSYRDQTEQHFTDVVHSYEFNSYKDQTAQAITNRVKSSDFSSYTRQTDNRLDMVVDGYGNINAARIAMSIKNNSSAISMIADNIEIKPNNGVIEFPNGTSLDTRDSYGGMTKPQMIRLRGSRYCYILMNGKADGGLGEIGLYFKSPSGGSHEYWTFTRGTLYKDGKAVL